jgi:hypothetical protein
VTTVIVTAKNILIRAHMMSNLTQVVDYKVILVNGILLDAPLLDDVQRKQLLP